MGAETFYTQEEGPTAKAAFSAAVSQARWDHGNSGYTGTVAEKSVFVLIELPEGREPEEYADELIHTGDPRVDSKWGSAGCIKIPGKDKYLFFGWASS